MNAFDKLYKFRKFSGVYRIGNAPYEKGMYIILVKDYGYVAVYVNGEETEVFDPKGRFHPSIQEYLKMCNVHSARFNSFFYKDEISNRICDFVKSRLNLSWGAVSI